MTDNCKSMLPPEYACLLALLASLNNVGSCSFRSYIRLGESSLNFDINVLDPLGNNGIMSNIGCLTNSINK